MADVSLRVAICDDRAEDREILRQMTLLWANQSGFSVQIDDYPSAESFLFACEDAGVCDILLLDVEMGPLNGVDLAKALRTRDERVQIVFVTGYNDYISSGYDVEALHYLVKPVHEDRLFPVLSRAVERLHMAERVLTLQTAEGTFRVPLRRITHIDVRANYVTVHAREPYTVKRTLGELQRELDGRFYRVSRSTVVNLTRVARVSKTEIRLTDGTAIPLPRGAYEGVNRAIIAMG